MRLGKCTISNFGSFQSQEFDFSSPGLHLVYGATGSGKSTIIDAPSWILYGATQKDGTVDEVRSWSNPTQVTSGALEVHLPSGNIVVTRIRGTSSQNDLYWDESDGTRMRGKDVLDTQKLLEKRLGSSSDLYHTRSTYNDSTPTGNFFMAQAKERREILEQIANLEFSVSLTVNLTESRKAVKKQLAESESKLGLVQARLDEKCNYLEQIHKSSERFDLDKADSIKAAEEKSIQFDIDKYAKLLELSEQLEGLKESVKPDEHFQKTCPTCNGVSFDPAINQNNKLNREIANLQNQIKLTNNVQNPHLNALNKLKNQINPFTTQKDALINDIEKLSKQESELVSTVDSLKTELNGLDTLLKLTGDLKGLLLVQAINEIQDIANKYLSTYFDSEMRISLEVDKADKITLVIHKGPYECTYRQLSKGQKCLLRLCFVLAVMRVASNRAGTYSQTLFLDEALSGLDSQLKVKAFTLFQALGSDYKSIYVIDHELDFQNLFDSRYRVSIKNDISTITKED